MLHFETIIPETKFILEDLMRREELRDYRLVGDLMHFESDPFIDEPNIVSGIRLASTRDISAMKLNAITSRSEKKDFIDINELLSEYTIKEMLEHYEQKYPYNDPKDVIFAFSAIDKADSSYMPKMFINLSWEQVKENIKQQFRDYLDQETKL